MCEKIWSVGCGLVFLDPSSKPFPSQLPLIEVSVSCNSRVLTAPGEEVTRAQKTLMRNLGPPPSPMSAASTLPSLFNPESGLNPEFNPESGGSWSCCTA